MDVVVLLGGLLLSWGCIGWGLWLRDRWRARAARTDRLVARSLYRMTRALLADLRRIAMKAAEVDAKRPEA